MVLSFDRRRRVVEARRRPGSPRSSGPVGALAWWLVGRGSGRRAHVLFAEEPPLDPEVALMTATPARSARAVPPTSASCRHLMITKLPSSEMDNNVYLLRCRRTDEQLLIDAADDAAPCCRPSAPAGSATVVTTHQHWDHHRALPEVVEATGATDRRRHADADELPVPSTSGSATGTPSRVGECTPGGHPPGRSHTRLDRAALRRPRGHAPPVHRRLPLPRRGRQDLVARGLHLRCATTSQTKLFDRLPDETWFYPGHGADCTLGAERPHLARVARARLVAPERPESDDSPDGRPNRPLRCTAWARSF